MNPPNQDAWRTCFSKKRYSSEETVKSAITLIHQARGTPLRHYRCPFCTSPGEGVGWHLTKQGVTIEPPDATEVPVVPAKHVKRIRTLRENRRDREKKFSRWKVIKDAKHY